MLGYVSGQSLFCGFLNKTSPTCGTAPDKLRSCVNNPSVSPKREIHVWLGFRSGGRCPRGLIGRWFGLFALWDDVPFLIPLGKPAPAVSFRAEGGFPIAAHQSFVKEVGRLRITIL